MDELEIQLGDHIHIIRLDAQQEVGRELAPVFGFNFTPTFIFFDAEGEEQWREMGDLDTQRVRESVE